jgi:hypothetical protein
MSGDASDCCPECIATRVCKTKMQNKINEITTNSAALAAVANSIGDENDMVKKVITETVTKQTAYRDTLLQGVQGMQSQCRACLLDDDCGTVSWPHDQREWVRTFSQQQRAIVADLLQPLCTALPEQRHEALRTIHLCTSICPKTSRHMALQFLQQPVFVPPNDEESG